MIDYYYKLLLASIVVFVWINIHYNPDTFTLSVLNSANLDHKFQDSQN